jgi:acetyl esterase/lipase
MDERARVTTTTVVVGRAGERELQADVYRPPAALGDPPPAGWPAVLLIHGGAWQTGDRSQLAGYGVLLGRAGYLCVACEYRLSPAARWPEHLHDVKTALRWMRANAADLGIDPDRIAVHGNSAGGHLALVAAGTPDVPELEGDGGHAGAGTTVNACIAVYPPTVLTADHPEADVRAVSMITDRPSPEVARQATPVTYAGADFPPTLLIHGSADELVPVSSSRAMWDALRRAGAPCEVHIYADQPHAFDAQPRFGRRLAADVLFFLERYLPATPAGRRAPAGVAGADGGS